MAIKIEYDKKLSKANLGLFADVGQGSIGISTGAVTNFFSLGFSGCLGMVFYAEGKPAGSLVAHVHQQWAKSGRRMEYLIEATSAVTKLAQKTFPNRALDLVLFRGEYTSKPEVEYEGMPADLQKLWRDSRFPKTLSIQDLRSERAKASDLFLNANTRTLYLWKGIQPLQMDDDIAELVDTNKVNESMFKGRLTSDMGLIKLAESKFNLGWKRFP